MEELEGNERKEEIKEECRGLQYPYETQKTKEEGRKGKKGKKKVEITEFRTYHGRLPYSCGVIWRRLGL
ncbi:hypothetical protein V1478_013947, partial [Vespula squamosa]